MTQNNPYKYGDDLDDDIFDTDSETTSGEKVVHRHTLDGTVCPTCHVVHAIAGLPDNLPPQVMERLLDFIDNIPDEVLQRADGLLAAAVPPQAKLVMDFMNFMTNLDNANHEGPLIQAMARILDDRTEGHCTRLWEYYDAERHLITSHLVLNTVNTHLVDARGNDAPAEVLTMLQLLCDVVKDRIAAITELYREKAEVVGLLPNETLINTGNHGDDKDALTTHTMYEALQSHLE